MNINALLLTSLLVLSLILSACGSKKTDETTVNLPAISGEGGNVTEPTAPSGAPSAENAYPVGQSAEPNMLEAALAYPVDGANPNYDAEMRAYIEQILGGTISIEDLFGKGADELRTILENAAQGRVTLNGTGLEKAVEWLGKQ